jgi:molybdenum-dependent DNA-binding transcriptional regulator ModE
MSRDISKDELARAEQRGVERGRAEVRDRLREVLDDRRRVVRAGEQHLEVVEAAVLDRLLDG